MDPVPLPLDGVRVVEIGRFASAPSCATVLADWGADVVKVEPPGGDPARGAGARRDGAGGPPNPRFDVHNRSRRSLAVDLGRPEGRAVLLALVAGADVVVTNLRPASMARLDIEPETLRAGNPGLVVAVIGAYDAGTAHADTPSYDHGAFWSYAGVASAFGDGDEPTQPAGGLGDRAAGSMLAGAVAAALYARERTGVGAVVRTSLVRTGLWLLASDAADALAEPDRVRGKTRADAPIPTLNSFRTGDRRWLWLQVMAPERDWGALCEALDAPWLRDDPRFGGGDGVSLGRSRRELLAVLDGLFARRPLAEWGGRLTAAGLVWSEVRALADVVADPEVVASDALTEVVDADGRAYLTIDSPCRFAGSVLPTRAAAPRAGEHTRGVLTSLGYAADDIDALVADGVVTG